MLLDWKMMGYSCQGLSLRVRDGNLFVIEKENDPPSLAGHFRQEPNFTVESANVGRLEGNWAVRCQHEDFDSTILLP